MKIFRFLFLLFVFSLIITSCNAQDLPLEQNVDINNENETDVSTNQNGQTDFETDEPSTPVYMFMLDDKLYVDTGEIEYGLKCGTMDRGFDRIIPVNEIPDENGEANFESDYKGAQFGRRENRMVSYVDGAWHIFAYNENSYDGVSVEITEATPTKLTLEITNHVRKELIHGEYFLIENYDEKTSQWLPADEICEYQPAFPDIAYIIKPAATTTVEVDFEWLYGALRPGVYRIVKDVIDSNGPGDFEKYWYMEEFTILN